MMMMGENRYNRSAHNVVEYLYVSWKAAQGRLYFSYGRKRPYNFARTVKPYKSTENKELFRNVHRLCRGVTSLVALFILVYFRYYWEFS